MPSFQVKLGSQMFQLVAPVEIHLLPHLRVKAGILVSLQCIQLSTHVQRAGNLPTALFGSVIYLVGVPRRSMTINSGAPRTRRGLHFLHIFNRALQIFSLQTCFILRSSSSTNVAMFYLHSSTCKKIKFFTSPFFNMEEN